MQLAVYVGLVHRGEQMLAASFRRVAEGHGDEVDVVHTCIALASWCGAHVSHLAPVIERYGEQEVSEPERLHANAMGGTRSGPVGLLRDLQDLLLLTTFVHSCWTVIVQAAQGARDEELLEIAQNCLTETNRQLTWLTTRIKQAAPQALLVAK